MESLTFAGSRVGRPSHAQMIETIQNTSALAERLRERIRRDGPITFCDWMKAALYDPRDGYYCQADRTRWGREGDYRTSPERSSLFGATFARYFARLYDELGRPSQWTIVEAGAGDGSFASDVLQTLEKSLPDVFLATTYVIDELSSTSQALVEKRLQAFVDRIEFKKIEDLAELSPGIVFSNELLDAFPVHRVTVRDGQLEEFYVTLDGNGNFEWQLDVPAPDLLSSLNGYFQELSIQLGEGQLAEVSFEIADWLRRVVERIRRGYVVTVDYGADIEELYSATAGSEGTLRGFYRHRFVDDLLARPGEQDLTTTVNWSFVKSAGARLGLEVVHFERQDRFLLAAGLLEQLEIESHACEDEAERLRLSTAAREMILPDGMASHFQVLVQKKL
jgi:SAM-dependent MidA family methyltransferase